MKAGIVSDSHGRVRTLGRAVELLVAHGAEAIVHCGDFGDVAGLARLAEAPVQTYAIGGNMDRHCLGSLMRLANDAGVTFRPQSVEVPLGDGRFLVAVHGDNEQLLEELVLGGQFPYVCHGHTHRSDHRRVGAVRIICPGALRSPRGRRDLTCALLDTESDRVEFLTVA